MKPLRPLSTLGGGPWLKGLLFAMLVFTLFGCAQIQAGKNIFFR